MFRQQVFMKEFVSEINLEDLGLSWCLRSSCNAGDSCSIPRSGRSPGGGHSNPLQYSCLENSMDRGARRATIHGVTKSQTGLGVTKSQAGLGD